MQRRTFVSGLLLVSGSGIAGHGLTMLARNTSERSQDPKLFASAMKGVNLGGISNELLLKLFSRQLTEQDRQALHAEVVNYNRNLFIVDAHSKRHGVPGFYRVTE